MRKARAWFRRAWRGPRTSRSVMRKYWRRLKRISTRVASSFAGHGFELRELFEEIFGRFSILRGLLTVAGAVARRAVQPGDERGLLQYELRKIAAVAEEHEQVMQRDGMLFEVAHAGGAFAAESLDRLWRDSARDN